MAVILTTRRSFLLGLTAAAAAPMIVRASSIMPVKVMPDGVALQSMTHPLMTDDEVYAWFRQQAGFVAQRLGVNMRAGWNGHHAEFNEDSLTTDEIETLPDRVTHIELRPRKIIL